MVAYRAELRTVEPGSDRPLPAPVEQLATSVPVAETQPAEQRLAVRTRERHAGSNNCLSKAG